MKVNRTPGRRTERNPLISKVCSKAAVLAVVCLISLLAVGAVAVLYSPSPRISDEEIGYQTSPSSRSGDPQFPSRIQAGAGRAKPLAAAFCDSMCGTGLPDGETSNFIDSLAENMGWDVSVKTSADAGYAAGDAANEDMSGRIRASDLAVVRPDAVIISAGTNDVGLPSGDVVVGVQHAIVEVRTLAPDVPIIVIGLLSNDDSVSPQAEKTYRDISNVSLNARGVYFVNTYNLKFAVSAGSKVPTPEGREQIAEWVSDDLVGAGL